MAPFARRPRDTSAARNGSQIGSMLVMSFGSTPAPAQIAPANPPRPAPQAAYMMIPEHHVARGPAVINHASAGYYPGQYWQPVYRQQPYWQDAQFQEQAQGAYFQPPSPAANPVQHQFGNAGGLAPPQQFDNHRQFAGAPVIAQRQLVNNVSAARSAPKRTVIDLTSGDESNASPPAKKPKTAAVPVPKKERKPRASSPAKRPLTAEEKRVHATYVDRCNTDLSRHLGGKKYSWMGTAQSAPAEAPVPVPAKARAPRKARQPRTAVAARPVAKASKLASPPAEVVSRHVVQRPVVRQQPTLNEEDASALEDESHDQFMARIKDIKEARNRVDRAEAAATEAAQLLTPVPSAEEFSSEERTKEWSEEDDWSEEE